MQTTYTITKPSEFFVKYEACKTWGDMIDLFKATNTNVLSNFIAALDSAKLYISLTMRDEAMLSAARVEFSHRDD
jgi:hypothetical protein